MALPSPPPSPLRPDIPTLPEWGYITTARLAADATALAGRLPADADLVTAIPRSGMVPAGLIAYALHLPLWECSRQHGLNPLGHGMRLDAIATAEPRHVVIVDDTAATGREMTRAAEQVRKTWPDAEITRLVVYCHPRAAGVVDLCAAYLPGGHFLEWNWANSIHAAACAFDFDGILVPDDCPEQRPLFLPRKAPIPLIVTGRHESAREATQGWLGKWGVRCEQLAMRDWGKPLEFDIEAISRFKAQHYSASDCTLFAESSPKQAKLINELTGKLVLCPELGQVLPPRRIEPPAPPPIRPSIARGVPEAVRRTVLACREAEATPETFGRSCACQRRCRRRTRFVSYTDCVECCS